MSAAGGGQPLPTAGTVVIAGWLAKASVCPACAAASVCPSLPQPPPRPNAPAHPPPTQPGLNCRADGSGLEPLADAWALDTEALCWRQLSIQGDAPSARNAAMLAPLGGGQLLYHGGWRPFVETFNDTYILQLES